MSLINILAPHVADMIAAGEVVERPASVIKELMENSIDAGARSIRVEIRGGGMRLIRVVDDGCGMSPEDAGLAFLRHATSKLRDERGLESIETLGFRGEALAAISAVSKIELRTRQKGAFEGTRVYLTAGDIQEMGPVGCPEGSSMSISELFYNTPARLKFMKSDKAEGSACVNTALRCALAHPEVSVRMIKDGEEQFFTPGDGKIKSAVYSLLGRDIAAAMLECEGESEGVKVRGFVSSPAACRGSRAMQFFFINGRNIKSLTIQAALEQAYKNSLLTGRFPACVLHLELNFGKVDVNVHPAKTEVKFSEEKKVFDAVYFAVSSALAGESRTAEIKLSAQTQKLVQPKADFYKSMSAAEYREKSSRPAESGYVRRSPEMQVLSFSQEKPAYAPDKFAEKPEIPVIKAEPIYKKAPAAKPERISAPEAAPAPRAAPEIKPEQSALPVPEFRIVGEAMSTYIIVEKGDELLLIDKHAAHERMIFDRLKAQGAEVMSQSLLLPVTVRADGETMELVEKNMELLEKAGFEIDVFGERELILRCVPADTEGSESALFEEICEKLRRGGALEEQLDEVLHSIACKAAIKAGMSTGEAERRVIAEKVLAGEVKYCPHGRPVSVALTKKELEKQFKRIV